MFNTLRTGVLLAALTGIFMVVGYLIGGTTGMVLAFGFAVVTNLFSYWNADKLVLSMQNAEEVDPRQAPDLYRTVEGLARNAGIPMPKVYLIHTDQPNAFATGRDPQNAAVAVSSGLLQRLEPREVAAVISHELAHIKHRDTLTMTITATFAGAIGMLAQFGFFFGGNRNNNPLGGIGALAAMIVDQPDAGVRGRSRRGGDLGRAAGPGIGLAQDIGGGAYGAERSGARKSGHGPSLHHQSPVGRLDGQPVRDPPRYREPHRRPGAYRRRNGRRHQSARPSAVVRRRRYCPFGHGAGRLARPHDGLGR